MRITIYHLLSTCSKKSFLKTKTRWGHPKQYNPRGDLLERLSRELNISKEEVLERILEERKYMLGQMGFTDII